MAPLDFFLFSELLQQAALTLRRKSHAGVMKGLFLQGGEIDIVSAMSLL